MPSPPPPPSLSRSRAAASSRASSADSKSAASPARSEEAWAPIFGLDGRRRESARRRKRKRQECKREASSSLPSSPSSSLFASSFSRLSLPLSLLPPFAALIGKGNKSYSLVTPPRFIFYFMLSFPLLSSSSLSLKKKKTSPLLKSKSRF